MHKKKAMKAKKLKKILKKKNNIEKQAEYNKKGEMKFEEFATKNMYRV